MDNLQTRPTEVIGERVDSERELIHPELDPHTDINNHQNLVTCEVIDSKIEVRSESSVQGEIKNAFSEDGVGHYDVDQMPQIQINSRKYNDE